MKGYSEKIELKSMRICDDSKGDALALVNRRFRIKNPGVLSPEAIYLLLELNPIVSIPIPRRREYRVIYGRRLFELASHVLKPSAEVTVNVVREKLSKETIERMQYIDTVLVPSFESLDISYSELYEIIHSDPGISDFMWSISSKSEFAKAFEISRSLLSQPLKGKI